MKKGIVLFLIVLLAAILRLYGLSKVPPSLDWDEASLGWNAYSILKTGSDEYGKTWPVSLRSFNDYKPPLYAYVAVPSLAIFGKTEFAVRFPSALAGILTVLATFFLTKQLFSSKKIALIATLLLAISPWHIQFSRVAFEANLALFFFVLGATLFVCYLHRPRFLFLQTSFLSFVLSIYSYHSPRLVVPLFLAGVIIYYRKTFLAHWKLSLLSALLFALSLYPLARNTLHVGSLQARFATVGAFQSGNFSPTTLVKNYLSHFNFDFLFLNGDGNMRHHAPDMGLLYLWELPFLLAGGYFLVSNRSKFLPILVVWFLAAPAASSLTADTPHAVRSLLFLPTYQIITAYGLVKLLPSRGVFVFCALAAMNIFYFLHQYFIHLPIEYAKGWQYGYKQMVQKVLAVENNYQRVYVTPVYDQPYIYFLFYGRIDPKIKNNGYFYSGFDKYTFSLTANDHNALYVVSAQDQKNLPLFKTIDEIDFPDGSPAFLIGKKG